jgi:hypothetical protein
MEAAGIELSAGRFGKWRFPNELWRNRPTNRDFGGPIESSAVPWSTLESPRVLEDFQVASSGKLVRISSRGRGEGSRCHVEVGSEESQATVLAGILRPHARLSLFPLASELPEESQCLGRGWPWNSMIF